MRETQGVVTVNNNPGKNTTSIDLPNGLQCMLRFHTETIKNIPPRTSSEQ